MRSTRGSVPVFLGLFLISMSVAATARADDISGVISATRTITRDSQLVGNVTCTVTGAACIAIAAPGITLDLGGFSITGQGDAATGCGGGQTAGEAGILIAGPRGVVVRGPGIIQRFRGHGVQISGGSTRVLVTQVTASTNCLSGIFITGATANDVGIASRSATGTTPTRAEAYDCPAPLEATGSVGTG
jgi:hypothetical protein